LRDPQAAQSGSRIAAAGRGPSSTRRPPMLQRSPRIPLKLDDQLTKGRDLGAPAARSGPAALITFQTKLL
jgi:hypothetical protein